MFTEIAGHEFWAPDGKTLWYDWQTPKGEDFWLSGYNLESGKRTAYHMQRNEWSIHFNVTRDGSLFCGDGGDRGQVAHALASESSCFIRGSSRAQISICRDSSSRASFIPTVS
jgi:oligogalacturonide lyase